MADARDARIVLADELVGIGVGTVGIHRAELVDLDQFVVEAIALLLEEDRTLAVEFDRQRDERHDRRNEDEEQRAR